VPVPSLRRDLVLWMVVLRRLTVVAGVCAVVLQHLLAPGGLELWPVGFVILGICLYNEVGRLLVEHAAGSRLAAIVNSQVALDTIALVVVLHFGGGITNALGVLFFAPAFFAYGAVLPLSHAFAHVAATTVELAALGVSEAVGLLTHHPTGFLLPDAYQQANFVALMVTFVSVVNALCTYLSHHLSTLLGRQDERSRALAAERGALLERNEREAARVRALLDVAQHVSGTHTVDALLRAVCDTTVALVRVPRVEIFLWDAERNCLSLAASRGLADEVTADVDLRYPADVPIVARLRAGEFVDFGAAPGHIRRAAVPFQRGFAAPMIYRGSFEGALFVGYDGENADELMELVQGIARQAALALVNVRTMEQQQEDAEVNRVLLDISQGSRPASTRRRSGRCSCAARARCWGCRGRSPAASTSGPAPSASAARTASPTRRSRVSRPRGSASRTIPCSRRHSRAARWWWPIRPKHAPLRCRATGRRGRGC
jgi:hypothetical protein